MRHPERIEPAAGQESVWDFPRPPRLEPSPHPIRIVHAGAVVAETDAALRVLETSHPPTYYVPAAAVTGAELRPARGAGSFCEWKGQARYWDLVVPSPTGGDPIVVEQATWGYPEPSERFAAIVDHLAFYAARLDGCFVGGEKAEPQPGGFYGGWVTSHVVGPFKGGPGSWGW